MGKGETFLDGKTTKIHISLHLFHHFFLRAELILPSPSHQPMMPQHLQVFDLPRPQACSNVGLPTPPYPRGTITHLTCASFLLSVSFIFSFPSFLPIFCSTCIFSPPVCQDLILFSSSNIVINMSMIISTTFSEEMISPILFFLQYNIFLDKERLISLY